MMTDTVAAPADPARVVFAVDIDHDQLPAAHRPDAGRR